MNKLNSHFYCIYDKRRIVVAFFVWIVATLLLWFGGGLDLRPSAIFSLIVALICDQVIIVQQFAFEPRESQGVYRLYFSTHLERILYDLGVIDDSTNLSEVHELYKPSPPLPAFYFPTYMESCEWIPGANVFFWPYQLVHRSDIELNLFLQLPPRCPLGKTRNTNEKQRGMQTEESYCRVTFFIKHGQFGLRVPKEFVDARLEAGGLGDACMRSDELFGQCDLVVGRLPPPFVLFRPRYKPSMYPAFSVRKRKKYLQFIERRKGIFESEGWTLKQDDLSEFGIHQHETAKHKYMEIEISNDPN